MPRHPLKYPLSSELETQIKSTLLGEDSSGGKILKIYTDQESTRSPLVYALEIQDMIQDATIGDEAAKRTISEQITTLDFSCHNPSHYPQSVNLSHPMSEILFALDIFKKLFPNIEKVILNNNAQWNHLTLLSFLERFPNLKTFVFELDDTALKNFKLIDDYYRNGPGLVSDLCRMLVDRNIQIESNIRNDFFAKLTQELRNQSDAKPSYPICYSYSELQAAEKGAPISSSEKLSACRSPETPAVGARASV